MHFAIAHGDMDGFGCASILILANAVKVDDVFFCGARGLHRALATVPADATKIYICDLCVDRKSLAELRELISANKEIVIIDHHECETDDMLREMAIELHKNHNITATEGTYRLFASKMDKDRLRIADLMICLSARIEGQISPLVIEKLDNQKFHYMEELAKGIHMLPYGDKRRLLLELEGKRVDVSKLIRLADKEAQKWEKNRKEAISQADIRDGVAVLSTDKFWMINVLLSLPNVLLGIIVHPENDFTRISIRSKEEDLMRIASDLVVSSDGKAGLHRNALGGELPSNKWEELIENLRSRCRRYLSLRDAMNRVEELINMTTSLDKECTDSLRITHDRLARLLEKVKSIENRDLEKTHQE
ncbi:MAG: hypothetical protein ACFFBS_07330 [Promethearchaeota archaeon]